MKLKYLRKKLLISLFLPSWPSGWIFGEVSPLFGIDPESEPVTLCIVLKMQQGSSHPTRSDSNLNQLGTSRYSSGIHSMHMSHATAKSSKNMCIKFHVDGIISFRVKALLAFL